MIVSLNKKRGIDKLHALKSLKSYNHINSTQHTLSTHPTVYL